MQCPKCQLTIKSQSKFCNHCGTKLEWVDSNDADLIEQQEQSHIPGASASSEQQQMKTSDNKSLVFALLIGLGSGLLIWIISFLLSLTKQHGILSKIWEYTALHFLNLPLAKTILIEQQINTSMWYIANQFIGGFTEAKYYINDSLNGGFSIHLPMMLFIFILVIVAFVSQTLITAYCRKKADSVSLFTRLLASIIYSVATWSAIAVPLFIFAPSYHLPFADATETLQLQLAFMPGFLNGIAIIAFGVGLAWLPIKQFKLPAIMTIVVTLLIFIRDLCLAWYNDAGLDSLWLNRFIIDVAPTTFSSTALIMWLVLIFIAINSSALSWTLYSRLIALITVLIAFSYYFTTLSINHIDPLFSKLVQQLSIYENSNSLITGLILPIIGAVTIFIFVKLLLNKAMAKSTTGAIKHLYTYKATYTSVLLLLVILLSTTLMLTSQPTQIKAATAKQVDKTSFANDWAKQLYLMQHGPSEYALIHAQKLWAVQGSAESKALLALSYIQSYQPVRGQVLLNEAIDAKNKLFTSDELTSILELTDTSNPLSAINQATLVATNAMVQTDEQWHTALDQTITPEISKLLVEIVSQKLPKLISSNVEELHQQVKLDPDYIDFVKVLDEANVTSMQAAYEESTQLMNEEITTIEQQIAELELNHLEDGEQLEKEQADAHNKWKSFVKGHLPHLLALAKAALYYDDLREAEKLLALIVTTYPEHEEAALLLSALYLNGYNPSSNLIKQSDQYNHASLEVSDLMKDKLSDVLKDYVITTEQHLNETIANTHMTEQVPEQLAFELLKPFAESSSAEIDYQLAKYYFHTNQEDLALKQVEKLDQRVDELEASQQQIIEQLKSLPQHSRDMSIEEMQLRHELTEQLYYEMDPMQGKSFYDRELTSKEQAFSVYLSQTILSFNKSAIQLTSLQYEKGTVTLYLQSDNVTLQRDKLAIADNGQEINDFELTKLGESSAINRYVMLILDRSGSMQGEKIEVAKQSAIDFVHALQYGEHVGVITFNDSTSLDSVFTTNTSTITDVLASIGADAGTRIAPALNLGIDKLQYEKGERIAFILSDGEDSEFSDASIRQSIIHEANRAGITIYAVGFDAGYQTLRDVAEGTGGYYIGATDFESLSQSFDKISETLSQTYQIKYNIDPEDYGRHVVNIKQHEYEDEKDYVIVDPSKVDETLSGLDNGVNEILENTFNITSFTPNKILVSDSGSTLITVEGTRLKDVNSITFRDKEIDFNVQSQTKLTFKVSNKQPKGKLAVTFKTKNNEQKSITLTFTDSKVQQSMAFGYATLYGDNIETKKGLVEISGNPSIDHFIYPHSNAMSLDNDETLTYTGLDLYTNKVHQTVFSSKMEMSMADFGKLFDIESQGLYNKTMNQLPGLDRFGISMRLARAIEYEAHIHNDEGTLKLSGGMQGFDKLNQLNQNLKFKVNTSKGLLEFLPNQAMIEQQYTLDGYTLNADFGLNIAMPMLHFDAVEAGFKYESPDKRVVIKGKTSGFELFRMQTSGNSLGSVGLELGFHFANGFDRFGADLETNIPVPLATSGLGVNQLGLVADWSKKNEGSLTLGLTTMSDAALNRIVTAVNSIPVVNKIFNIDPSICLVCLSGTLGFTELGSQDWSLNGKIGAELLGLQLSEASAKATRNEIEVKKSENLLAITLDQTQTIVFRDPLFRNYTTLKYHAEVDPVGLNPHTFVAVLVPQQINASYLELSKEKKGQTITIQRVGNKLNMIKS